MGMCMGLGMWDCGYGYCLKLKFEMSPNPPSCQSKRGVPGSWVGGEGQKGNEGLGIKGRKKMRDEERGGRLPISIEFLISEEYIVFLI